MAAAAKPRSAKSTASNARLKVLQSSTLKKMPWLAHGFSTRPGGATTCYGERSLNLGITKEDSAENVERNRALFLRAIGAAEKGQPWPLVAPRQIHSDVIHVIRSAVAEQLAGDGLITNQPQLALGIRTADCFPVLLVDKGNRAIGAFHAGWRGTVQRIVEKGVGAMRREYGSRPQDIYAVIGPGIQKCCYAVGDELRAQFESQFPYASELFHTVQDSDPVRKKYPLLFMNQRPPGHGDLCIKLHLDLREANHRQLLDAGVPEKQITAMKDCTACDTGQFFSHRAEKGRTGRMIAVIGIKSR